MNANSRWLRTALLSLLAASVAHAQQSPDGKVAAMSASKSHAAAVITTPAVTTASTPVELARAAVAAQGGDKFRQLKNMVLTGSVELFSPNSTQSLAGKFGLIAAGDKLRLVIQSPIVSFELVHDGLRAYTTLRAIDLPPPGKFGLPALARFDQPGFAVTALPAKKKELAFRLTDPEGNATNFYLDTANARVVRYEIPYNGLTFVWENKSFREIDGVLVPVAFAERLDAPQGAFFAEFKVKEAKINQDLPADAFAPPGRR